MSEEVKKEEIVEQLVEERTSEQTKLAEPPLAAEQPPEQLPEESIAQQSEPTEKPLSQEPTAAENQSEALRETTPQPAQESPPVSPSSISAPVLEPAEKVVPLKNLWRKALEKIQFRKRRRLEKVMTLARRKRRIVNDDVEKLLHVSDATASRYLGQLVKEGKLRRSGAPSRAFYEPM